MTMRGMDADLSLQGRIHSESRVSGTLISLPKH